MNKRRRFKAKSRRARRFYGHGYYVLPSGHDQAWWVLEMRTWDKPRVIVHTINRRNSGGGYDHVTRPAAKATP